MDFSLASYTIAAVAAATSISNVVLGVRARRCDVPSARLRFAAAVAAFAIASSVAFGIIESVAGYGTLCLTLVSVMLFDLVREEQTRRRRVASLKPRPAAEAMPIAWVSLSAASVVMLVPYVVLDEQRAAALIVGFCAMLMAGIAWRIASAPEQLIGDDVRTERLRDRAARSLRAGLSAVLAIGSIFVFITFVNAALPEVTPLQHLLLFVSFTAVAGLAAWVFIWSRLIEYPLHRAS